MTATVQRGSETDTRTFTVIVEGTNNQVLVLKSKMTTADSEPYHTDTWTNQSVTVSVTSAVYAPATSATIELSLDGGQTYEPYTENTPLEITEAGEHKLLFRATDDLNEMYTLPLVVKIDREIPVITLQGSSQMTLTVGDTYNEPGAQAADNVGIRGSVQIAGTVNTQAVGIYTLRYNVKDIAGNVAQEVTRTVTVQARSGNGDGNGATQAGILGKHTKCANNAYRSNHTNQPGYGVRFIN
ncbi:immunoglobulin-like domain-containing protein [Paenibacillus sp. 1A_MP2]|uniref:immunoglobulin-like domain-containing protein n=1 Tax=Paenibacillus sp. 1A_MP2 TaxID=3457495 RepID=UPI003FCED34C